MSRLLKKIIRFIEGSEEDYKKDELIFKQKVKKIMKDEADFTSLYDYNDISNLSEKEKIVYLEDVTKRYLLAKSEILQKRNINF